MLETLINIEFKNQFWIKNKAQNITQISEFAEKFTVVLCSKVPGTKYWIGSYFSTDINTHCSSWHVPKTPRSKQTHRPLLFSIFEYKYIVLGESAKCLDNRLIYTFLSHNRGRGVGIVVVWPFLFHLNTTFCASLA